jgi:hypothetical protein
MSNSPWDAPIVTKSAGPLNEPSKSGVEPLPTIGEDVLAMLKAAKLPADRDGLLQLHAATKSVLDKAKASEMEVRRLSIAYTLASNDAPKKEGMNTVALGKGFEAKIEIPYTYTLIATGTKDVIDSIDDMIDDFAKIDSNEGSFIADRLIKWQAPTLSVSEYRKLCEDAKISVAKKALLDRLNKNLKITEGTGTLTIKEPKVKK